MDGGSPVEATVEIRRKHPGLPAYLVIPSGALAAWRLEGTTTVLAAVEGQVAGRRSLKRWDHERWFVELTRSFMVRAGLKVGNRVRLRMERASDALPDELQRLLEEVPAAAAAWQVLSPARRRALREHVFDAKAPATRERRARKGLGLMPGR
jgi:hypothetical protein